MSNFDSNDSLSLSIESTDRWWVYQRLQSLEIPCQCKCYKPLQIQVSSPLSTIQTWSVLRQMSASRQELADWLETCWQMPQNRNC
ncbi:MAG: hypothetical protein SWY16_21770 [Cyanobacteriota bacterium]|nr:hypothetical protein [Cyanobacteriota bacterium]